MGMTLNEAIDRLEDLHFEQDNWEYGELTEDCLFNREALRLAIDTMRKYQKMQGVLDKIRAEINKLTVYYTTKDKGINLISQNAVNRIFDKYKAEIEPQESEDKE